LELNNHVQSSLFEYDPGPSVINPLKIDGTEVQPQLPLQSSLLLTTHEATLCLQIWDPSFQLLPLDQPVLHEQASITLLPTTECEFAGHARHCDLSAAEYDPAAQDSQRTADVVENVPGAQAMQLADPRTGLYLPATQRVQSILDPVQPALHTHNVMSPVPGTESVLSTHATHSVRSAAEYDPAAQGTQRTTGGMEYSPGPQKAQSPEALFVVVHERHADEPLATYDPTAQSEHGPEPCVGLYLAATHPLQLSFLPDQPALHKQKVILSLPIGECEFWGHEMHTFLVVFEYDPAKQSVHVLLVEVTLAENFPLAQSEHA